MVHIRPCERHSRARIRHQVFLPIWNRDAGGVANGKGLDASSKDERCCVAAQSGLDDVVECELAAEVRIAGGRRVVEGPCDAQACLALRAELSYRLSRGDVLLSVQEVDVVPEKGLGAGSVLGAGLVGDREV